MEKSKKIKYTNLDGVGYTELVYPPCEKVFDKKKCDCLFPNNENNCYESYSPGCKKIAQNRCSECGDLVPNLCDPKYGGFYEKFSYNGLEDYNSLTAESLFGYSCAKYLKDKKLISDYTTTNKLLEMSQKLCSDKSSIDCVNQTHTNSGFCSKSEFFDGPCSQFCSSCCDKATNSSLSKNSFVKNSTNGGACSATVDNPCSCIKCISSPSSAPGGPPLDVMYRHTGCHFIWWPPEYAFGGNPAVNQCTAWYGAYGGGDGPGAYSCHPNKPDGHTDDITGIDTDAVYDDDCYTYANWPSYPCRCGFFPHISGGIEDTVYKRPNHSTKEYQLGYFPFMEPFAPRMKKEEGQCCWCISAAAIIQGTAAIPGSAVLRKNQAQYPNGTLKYKAEFMGGIAGVFCRLPRTGDENFTYNPGYKKTCFQYGISPYLLRISFEQNRDTGSHKLGYDIWTFGGASKRLQDFGPIYTGSGVRRNRSLDNIPSYSMSFRPVFGQRSLLRDQLVGFVTLEHHFESWAFKSDSGSQHPNLEAPLNHVNVAVPPFEPAYTGTYTTDDNNAGTVAFHPEECMRYSLHRVTPRRFQYAGSQIPLFHFDLYAFENYSTANNIIIQGDTFKATRFLKSFYNYFYSMLTTAFEAGTAGGAQAHIENPINIDYISDYDYVVESLDLMVDARIIRIKDHAIDIAEETNAIIKSASIDANNNIELDPYISAIVGGTAGYLSLVNFLGVCAGTGTVTPEIIRTKLPVYYENSKVDLDAIENKIPTDISSDPYRTTGDSRGATGPAIFNIYPFPRRAVLPAYIQSGIIVAWGCGDPNCCPDPTLKDVPSLFNPDDNTNPDTKWLTTGIEYVVAGFQTNWYITYTGKIAVSGNVDYGVFNIPPDIALSDLEAENSNLDYGIVKKLGSKAIKFQIALTDYVYKEDLTSLCGDANESDRHVCIVANSGNGGPGIDCRGTVVKNAILDQYKLKAWGDKVENSVCSQAVFGQEEHPYNPNGYRNKDFRWSDVSTGCKHSLALSCYGTIYAVGDNNYGQRDEVHPFLVNEIYPWITKNNAKPGYISDGEYDVASTEDVVTSPFGNDEFYTLNGNTYVNLNYYLKQTPEGEEIEYMDVRVKLLKNTLITSDDTVVNWTSPNPYFSIVGSGHYHNVAIQSDNTVKIWGKYVDVDKNGDVDEKRGVYDVFIPDEVKNLSQKWNVTYWTEADFPNDKWGNWKDEYAFLAKSAELISQPISDSNRIIFADGGPDYTIIATERTIYVWGRKEMLPNFPEADKPEDFGFYSQTFEGRIIKITAGLNGWGVLYQSNTNSAYSNYSQFKINKHFIWERKIGDGCKMQPETEYEKSEFGYQDLSIGYGQVFAIKYGDIVSPEWDYQSFVDRDARKAQFSNDIPHYFKRQAFFRAIPGNWDFSKWIWGGPCGFALQDSISLNSDPCSILGQEDLEWSYSGLPQYFWMSPRTRRYQFFVPNHTTQPNRTTCSDVLIYGQPGGVLSSGKQSVGALACPWASDICWQSTGLPLLSGAGPFTPKSCDPDTERTCQTEDCGRPCYKECCSDNCQLLYADCTSCVGRNGFTNTKDYFIQSYKAFGKVNETCCGAKYNNISYVCYAERHTYFGFDKTDKTYKLFVAQQPYRIPRYYSGPPGSGSASDPEGCTFTADGRITGKNCKEVVGQQSQPTNPNVVVMGNALDNLIYYPPVYCGGGPAGEGGEPGAGLQQVENSLKHCASDNTNPDDCSDVAKCTIRQGSKLDRILGPGGWVWGYDCGDGTVWDGNNPTEFGNSIIYNQKIAPVESAFDIMGKYTTSGATTGLFYLATMGNTLEPYRWYEIKIFDPDDEKNYNKPGEVSSKWYKIPRLIPNNWKGVTFGRIYFGNENGSGKDIKIISTDENGIPTEIGAANIKCDYTT